MGQRHAVLLVWPRVYACNIDREAGDALQGEHPDETVSAPRSEMGRPHNLILV